MGSVIHGVTELRSPQPRGGIAVSCGWKGKKTLLLQPVLLGVKLGVRGRW